MECRVCNGCGCWPASCRFMRCLGRGHCCTCLQPSRSAAAHADPASLVVATPGPGGTSNAPAVQQQKMEYTSEQLEDLIDFVEQKVALLDLAGSSSSSQASISQHPGNMLAKWEENKQNCTSLIESLPKELKDEVAENGRNLLVPLISRALGGLEGMQWIGVGFTFLAWSLSNTNNFIQNREDCIRLLRCTLRLLKHTKEVWELTTVKYSPTDYEEFQDSAVKALCCAVFCSSNLTDHWILRFLKATSVKDAISNLEEQVERKIILILSLPNKHNVEGLNVQRQVTFADFDNVIVGERETLEVIEDAVTFLEADSQDHMKAVLLHGMGGIGKSTLGLRIFTHFQKNRAAYQACRVELTLETKEEDLFRTQQQIIEKVSRHASKFADLTEGMHHMKKELQQISQPIFLYVDNVLERQYLSELLPKASFFPKGSRLLITAREKYTARHLLVDLGISVESYKAIEVRKLPKQEAQQLLRKQLQSQGNFRVDSKIESAEERVLALCDGLPLALVIVGKYIAASEEGVENVEVWHEVVKSMEKAESFDGGAHDKLYGRLGFSIQNLDGNVKRDFLDVAFFFKISSQPCYPLKTVERLVGQSNLRVLIQRALLQIHEKGHTVEMHDVLKALGSRKVKEDQQELRISGMDEFNELDGSDLNKVVALSGVRKFDALRFKQMPHLRLLRNVHVMQECNEIQLRELRVVVGLRSRTSGVCNWAKCVSLKEVAWEKELNNDWRTAPAVSNLEVFKHDNLSKTLEVLSLSEWHELKELQVIVTLTRLRELKLIECYGIQSLPEEISQLTALEQLSLRKCIGLECLPQGISRLLCLKGLDLTWCESLESIPEGIASLSGLTQLDLEQCQSLRSIPEGIASLTGLTQLDLRECQSLRSIPEGIASLTGLTQLILNGCKSLRSIPEGIASLTGLTELSLSECGRLQSIPEGIASLTGLTKLYLFDCASLQSIPEGIASLTRLTNLGLDDCRSLQSIPEGIASLTRLTHLGLGECGSLQSIPEGIASLTGLTQLYLGGCESLQSIPEGIASLTELEFLTLSGCRRLQSIPEGIASLTRLTLLDLRGCESLQSIPEGIASLTGLTELYLSKCRRLQSIPERIASLTRLTLLDLKECESLQSIPEGIASLTELEFLNLSGCSSLRSLPESVLRRLCLKDDCQCLGRSVRLDLSGCTSLTIQG